MRLIFLFMAIALAALGQDAVWRPPKDVPVACPRPSFELLLLDVSGSMNRAGLFEKTRESIANYIQKDAAECTLEILGSFGTTSDLLDAVFLVSHESRLHLATHVLKLRATHTSTNLDEAAKLIELLSYQLRETYGAAASHLVVRVYSDFESSPTTGKLPFSLGGYLANRLSAEYRRFPNEIASGAVVTVRSKPDTTLPTAPPPAAPPRNPRNIWIPAGLLVATFLGWAARRVWPRRSPPDARPLRALLVNEHTAGSEPTPGTASPASVPMLAGVPAVFSTERDHAAYVVASLPGEVTGELFRIESLAGCRIEVRSPHSRMTVNGEPLDHLRRCRLSLDEPAHIRLGGRSFTIAGAFEHPSGNRHRNNAFDAKALKSR